MEYILFILDWNKMAVLMECFFLIAMLWVWRKKLCLDFYVHECVGVYCLRWPGRSPLERKTILKLSSERKTILKLSSERKAQSARRRAQGAERRAQSAERRAQSAERRAQSAERRAAERRAQSAEHRAPSAERKALYGMA